MINEIETNAELNEQDYKPKMTFNMKYGLRIRTWNVRTLLGISRLAQLCKSFRDYRLNLLGISEVRWPDRILYFERTETNLQVVKKERPKMPSRNERRTMIE